MSRGFRDAGAGAVDHVRGSQTSRRVRPIFLVVPRSLHRDYGSGDLHFITCSCFQRQPLLAFVRYRDLFLKVLEAVRRRCLVVVEAGDMIWDGIGGFVMFKSALFYVQFQAFFAGFFFCAGVTNGIRHPSNTLWIDFSILSVVFLLWSKRYAEKLRRKLPQIGDVKLSD